jgi:hypothetical protein
MDGEYWMSSFGAYFGWIPDQISLATELMVYGRYPGEIFQPFIGLGPDIDYLPIHNGMDQTKGTFRSGGWGPKLKWGCEILRRYELGLEYKPWNLSSTSVSFGLRI